MKQRSSKNHELKQCEKPNNQKKIYFDEHPYTFMDPVKPGKAGKGERK
jgi:hypothetical protein